MASLSHCKFFAMNTLTTTTTELGAPAEAPGMRVDDERNRRDSLALFVRGVGYSRRVAHDGFEACAICGANRTDVILPAQARGRNPVGAGVAA